MPTSNNDFHRKNINWSLLSATRFLLAMIVLSAHLAYFQTNVVTRFMSLFDSRAAVISFFVISGFSVASSFDSDSNGFISRRFLRIYPAYLFSMVLAIALQIQIGVYSANGIVFSRSGTIDIIGNALLLQTYVVKVLSYNPACWSLAIEFSYYIFLTYFNKIKFKYLVFLFIISIFYFAFVQQFNNSHYYLLLSKLYMVRCLWPFLVGVALNRRPTTAMYLAVAILGAAALIISNWTDKPYQYITYLFTISAVYVAQRGYFSRRISMDWLGDISYPLYLVHIPTGIFFAAILKIYNPLVITSASLTLAGVFTVFLERPARKMLRKLGSVLAISASRSAALLPFGNSKNQANNVS